MLSYIHMSHPAFHITILNGIKHQGKGSASEDVGCA
jgi:hypothetical protein